MLKQGFGAAAIGALFVTAVTMGWSGVALAAECTGPFAKCAAEVGAKCTRQPDGRMYMEFYDKGGYSRAFEECVGKVFEAHGRPNPYRPGSQQKPAPKR